MPDFFEKIRSGAERVAKEADSAAHIKRIEFDIGGIKKQIESQYTRLGEITYRSISNKEPQSPEAADICAKVTDLMGQISLKEDEIKKFKSVTEKTQGASPMQEATSAGPQKKICTNCGKENEADVKFCAECGTKFN